MAPPLLVDLDRTFLRHDVFWQDLWLAFRHRPWKLLVAILLGVKHGRATMKISLARFNSANRQNYPLNPEFNNFLKQQQLKRCKIWLITGAVAQHAFAVSSKYGYFSKVLATTNRGIINPAAKLKWVASQKITEFDYAGDRLGDLLVFKKSRISYVVNPSFGLFLALLGQRSLRVQLFDCSRLIKFIKWLLPRSWFAYGP